MKASTEERVRRWGKDWVVEFCTYSGKLMSDGISQELADQQAYIAVGRAKREQEGKG